MAENTTELDNIIASQYLVIDCTACPACHTQEEQRSPATSASISPQPAAYFVSKLFPDIEHPPLPPEPPRVTPTTSAEGRARIQHELWFLTLKGRLQISPLPTYIDFALDIGAGTGLWAVDFAKIRPKTLVVAMDVVYNPWVATYPRNIDFVVHNAEADWMEHDVLPQQYGFIHGRMLYGSIKDWPSLFAKCFRHLEAGGWLELQDLSMPVRSANPQPVKTSALMMMDYYLNISCLSVGVNINAIWKFEDLLRQQGFFNITVETAQWALGDWPEGGVEKEIGRKHLSGIELPEVGNWLGTWLMGSLDWKRENVEAFAEEVRSDVLNEGKHWFHQMYIISAQKPFK